jgi:L,D-peptidoglycan transpeptidase YkuD (ErfK/YbiS/YcfS/YnhG family)
MPKDKPESFELMLRDDQQYSLGVVVSHNKAQIKNGGSCIFMHVQKNVDAPTLGCTSMKYKDLKTIVEWLDSQKNPILIQISKPYISGLKEVYPELELK